jgi:hypothetical protein
MNPQSHNPQQNNPPPHAAPPAGRWDEGANLNNAPVPLTIPPPSRQWRRRCADAGYIAGDEQVQPYVQNLPLLDDDGQMNTASLYGFAGTADSISKARAAGIELPLAQLAALMQARNWAMDAVDQAQAAQAAQDERTRAQQELRKLQDQVEQAQRAVLRMVHGEQPVGSMVGQAQGGVQLIPERTAMVRLLTRFAERHPLTTISLMVSAFALLLINLMAFLLAPRPGEASEDDGGVVAIFSAVACFFVAYVFLVERLWVEDRNPR